jgi:hypothetical protein
MSSLKQVFVDCMRDGRVIASYAFGYGETAGPSMPPSHQSLITEAKTNLTDQAIAYPPYAGIEFNVRWL